MTTPYRLIALQGLFSKYAKPLLYRMHSVIQSCFKIRHG